MINQVLNMKSIAPTQSGVQLAQAEKKEGLSFSQTLKESLNQLNESQVNSDRLTNAIVKGENVELHQVLIASQKASITMQATLEIRNKAVEAYQEIMRMNI